MYARHTHQPQPQNGWNTHSPGEAQGASTYMNAEMHPHDGMHEQHQQPPPRTRVQGKNRLFLGSLPQGLKEEELQGIFEKYGEISDLFHNAQKGFAFLKMVSWEAATKILEDWDGSLMHGRTIRVKRASHNSAVDVDELSTSVTNELLHSAFAAFGEVERAIVVCDERGNPTGKGLVEFARKNAAAQTIDKLNSTAYVLTKGGKPVRVKKLEHHEDEVGMDLSHLRRSATTDAELSVPPHFTDQGSVEHAYAAKWMHLYAKEEKETKQLEENHNKARLSLQSEMKSAMQKEEKRIMEQEAIRHKQAAAREARMREQEMQMMRSQQMRQHHGGPPMHGGPTRGPYHRDHEYGPPAYETAYEAPPPPPARRAPGPAAPYHGIREVRGGGAFAHPHSEYGQAGGPPRDAGNPYLDGSHKRRRFGY